ncbi:phage portal protein [Eubacteriales bacterium OttesenSCG-928-G02]|nr:phage portal protein [Eubacteriales bacterium OttesenSCG-928-G02]
MADENRTWTVGDILKNGDVLRGVGKEMKQRFEIYAIGLQNDFLSKDEVRQLEELPELRDDGK